MTAAAQPRGARRAIGAAGSEPRDEWSEVAEEWLGRAPQSLWRRHSDAVNSRLLERWLPASLLDCVLKTDLFDEAVANGLYPALSKHSRSVFALDISPVVSKAATKKYPRIGAFTADVRALPAASSSFDSVVSLSTLDHFNTDQDIERALAELFRVLKPGGTLVVTLDNAMNPVIAIRNRLPYSLTHGIGLVPYPVGRTLFPGRAREVVATAGFQVLECTAIMHAPRVIAVPLMNALHGEESKSRGASLLDAAMRFESLERLPTRFVTGHFIAVRAKKPGA